MCFVNLFILCAKGAILSLAKSSKADVVLFEKEPLEAFEIKI